MRILAIDPGPEKSQWLMWEDGHALSHAYVSNSSLASALRDSSLPADRVAIELMQGFGMPVGAEVFKTCYFIGAVIEICWRGNVPVATVFRKDIKLALCGTPRAKDANIRQALMDKLGAPGTKQAPGTTYGITKHAWSALAIAYYVRFHLVPVTC